MEAAMVKDPRKAKLAEWRQEKQKKEAQHKAHEKKPFVVPGAAHGLLAAEKNAVSGVARPLARSALRPTQIKDGAMRVNTPTKRKLEDEIERECEADAQLQQQRAIDDQGKDISVNLAGIFHSDKVNNALITDLMANMDFGIAPITATSMEEIEAHHVALASVTITPHPSSAEKRQLLDSEKGPVSKAPPLNLPTVDEEATGDKRTADHFRVLQRNAQEELRQTCEAWTAVSEGIQDEYPDIAEDIRAAIGQAMLLVTKKIAKFGKLCDIHEDATAELTAETRDLQGYWEGCIVSQIDQVNDRFAKLQTLKDKNWQVDEPDRPAAPKKSKATLTPKKSAVAKKPVPKRGGAMADFIAKQRASKQAAPPASPGVNFAMPTSLLAQVMSKTPIRTHFGDAATPGRVPKRTSFGAGALAGASSGAAFGGPIFSEEPLSILTPCRASKREKEELGTEFYLTPVRRSTRKTPSRYRSVIPDQDNIGKLLEDANFSFKPNPALLSSALGHDEMKIDEEEGEEEEGGDFDKYLFGGAASPMAVALEGQRREETLVPITPLRSFTRISEAGSHPSTPNSHLNDLLGCAPDSALRRSVRKGSLLR